MQSQNARFSQALFVDPKGLIILPRGQPDEDGLVVETIKYYDFNKTLSVRLKHISRNNWEEYVGHDVINRLKLVTDVFFDSQYAAHLMLEASERLNDYTLSPFLLEEFQRKSFNHQAAIKDLDHCEYHTILDLNEHDAAIEIQRIFRGNAGRLIAHGYDMCAWYERWAAIQIQRIFRGNAGRLKAHGYDMCAWYDAYYAATSLQSAWRRYKLRNELILRKALREIDLRLCRARYARVIDAAGVIHKAWANRKLAKRMLVMVGEQRRKEYANKHGLDDLFANLLDLAIKMQPIDPLSFVSTRMIRMKGKRRKGSKLV